MNTVERKQCCTLHFKSTWKSIESPREWLQSIFQYTFIIFIILLFFSNYNNAIFHSLVWWIFFFFAELSKRKGITPPFGQWYSTARIHSIQYLHFPVSCFIFPMLAGLHRAVSGLLLLGSWHSCQKVHESWTTVRSWNRIYYKTPLNMHNHDAQRAELEAKMGNDRSNRRMRMWDGGRKFILWPT